MSEPTGAETRARKVIAQAFMNTYVGHPWTREGADRRADGVLDDLSAAGLTITPAEVAASDGVTISRDILRTTILAWAEREFGARGIAATATLFAALRASAPATAARDEREGGGE
jgi:hypothetical protein